MVSWTLGKSYYLARRIRWQTYLSTRLVFIFVKPAMVWATQSSNTSTSLYSVSIPFKCQTLDWTETVFFQGKGCIFPYLLWKFPYIFVVFCIHPLSSAAALPWNLPKKILKRLKRTNLKGKLIAERKSFWH